MTRVDFVVFEKNEFLYTHCIMKNEKSHELNLVETMSYTMKLLEARNIEVVVCRCSSKKVFLKISRISQENSCVGVSI